MLATSGGRWPLVTEGGVATSSPTILTSSWSRSTR